jgi:hypothetical protein
MGKRGRASVVAELAALRGRRPWTEKEGRRVLEAWEASGDSIPAFARGAGLVPQRLYWWHERLGRGDALVRSGRAAQVEAPAFLPVTVRSPEGGTAGGAAAVFVSTEGLRIEVRELDTTSAAWVGAVVKSLREVAS